MVEVDVESLFRPRFEPGSASAAATSRLDRLASTPASGYVASQACCVERQQWQGAELLSPHVERKSLPALPCAAPTKTTHLRASMPTFGTLERQAYWWGPLDGPGPSGSSEPSPMRGATGARNCLESRSQGFVMGAATRNSPQTLTSINDNIVTGLSACHNLCPCDIPGSSASNVSPPRDQGIGEATALHVKLNQLSRGMASKGSECRVDQLWNQWAGVERQKLNVMVDSVHELIASKHALLEETHIHELTMRKLADELQAADLRMEQLERQAQSVGIVIPDTFYCQVDASNLTSEGFASEHISQVGVWHESADALEGELRRKSARALAVQGRVHRLEEQLREQLQSNDGKIDGVYGMLQSLVAAMQSGSSILDGHQLEDSRPPKPREESPVDFEATKPSTRSLAVASPAGPSISPGSDLGMPGGVKVSVSTSQSNNSRVAASSSQSWLIGVEVASSAQQPSSVVVPVSTGPQKRSGIAVPVSTLSSPNYPGSPTMTLGKSAQRTPSASVQVPVPVEPIDSSHS